MKFSCSMADFQTTVIHNKYNVASVLQSPRYMEFQGITKILRI